MLAGIVALAVACGDDDPEVATATATAEAATPTVAATAASTATVAATEVSATATVAEPGPAESRELAPGTESVDLAAAKDNTLYEDAAGAWSNGAGEHLFVGATNRPSIRRALIAFDLSGTVPEGATITAVRLTLALNRASSFDPHDLSLHRVLAE